MTLSVKMPDWYRMMSVVNPSGKNAGRPRRLSIHTITAICGRDGETILKEMEESKLVVGYVCPDVRTPIYYLIDNCKLPGMIDSRNNECWAKGREWLKRYDTKKVKGFKRFPFYKLEKGRFVQDKDHKHKGEVKDGYGYGCADECYIMDVPFDAGDADYEKLVRAAVKG